MRSHKIISFKYRMIFLGSCSIYTMWLFVWILFFFYSFIWFTSSNNWIYVSVLLEMLLCQEFEGPLGYVVLKVLLPISYTFLRSLCNVC